MIEIELIPAQELASRFGFARPNDSFRTFCQKLGIRPIRRNPNFYDVKHVRAQLDHAQNMSADARTSEVLRLSLVEQRKRRLAQR